MAFVNSVFQDFPSICYAACQIGHGIRLIKDAYHFVVTQSIENQVHPRPHFHDTFGTQQRLSRFPDLSFNHLHEKILSYSTSQHSNDLDSLIFCPIKTRTKTLLQGKTHVLLFQPTHIEPKTGAKVEVHFLRIPRSFNLV